MLLLLCHQYYTFLLLSSVVQGLEREIDKTTDDSSGEKGIISQ